MTEVRCVATCYMPSTEEGVKVERYEDDPHEDVYQIPDERVDEFLETGNFELVTS